MAGVMGAVKEGVSMANDILNGVKDQATLPEGEFIESGCTCDLPCVITGLCPCTPCIFVYMTWGKIMQEEAGKMGGIVALSNCLACCLGWVVYYVMAMVMPTMAGYFGSLPFCLMSFSQCFSLINQRKKLGKWMNVPEEKISTPQDIICAFFCCCLTTSAEQRTVEKWGADYPGLVEAPLKAAHEAKAQLEAAGTAVSGP